MANFDSLFFEQHIAPDEKIEKVFHRHFFVVIEDMSIWIFFGLIIPIFLYFFDVFGVRTVLDPTYVHAYLFIIYFILLYKIFDWYLDVWIATDKALIEMRWKWFTPQLLYIGYHKIESIEIRTPSWLYSLLSISDVIVHQNGEEMHALTSASNPKDIVDFLRNKTKKHDDEEDIPEETHQEVQEEDKEPFEVLVDTLSGVVKNHLSEHGEGGINAEYIDKLDATLSRGIPIDLRTIEDKTSIERWKKSHTKIPISSHAHK